VAINLLAGLNILKTGVNLYKSIKSKPENPTKTEPLSSAFGATGLLGSAAVVASSANSIGVEGAASLTGDPLYDLIMGVLGLVVSYGLTQLRDHSDESSKKSN